MNIFVFVKSNVPDMINEPVTAVVPLDCNEPVTITLPVKLCTSSTLSPNFVDPDENDSVKYDTEELTIYC